MGTDDPIKMGLAVTKSQPHTKLRSHEGHKTQIENRRVGAARRADPNFRREAPFLFRQNLPQSR